MLDSIFRSLVGDRISKLAQSKILGIRMNLGQMVGLMAGLLVGAHLIQAFFSVEHTEAKPGKRVVTGDHKPLFSLSDQGRAIYENQCQHCHGREGEGSEYYRQPLLGDLPVEELAVYIDQTMPEDDPDACSGEEATQVALYVFKHFYSPAAQQRRQPAISQFSRLTVRQFKESVADILGNFSSPDWLPAERGLRAYYFASRHWNDKRKLSEQIESMLDFSETVPYFDPSGEYSQLPPKEKSENQMGDGFSAYWQGSLLAPRTGWYEIKVQTQNGFQLSLNRQDEPLIDYGVRSGDTALHTARIYLLEGRSYPLNIYLVAFPEPTTSFRLLWTPPDGIEEIIPQRFLLPHKLSPSLALTTSFPPDDSSTGYARGISISQEWDEAVTAAAIETAQWVGDNLWQLAKTTDSEENRLEKVQDFCRQFVSLAFVKELQPEEYDFFVGQHFQNDLPIRDQVSRVVILTLKSPRFIYPNLESRSPSLEVARRLALFLWDSVPDRELMELARQGQLTDGQTCQNQIHRMLHHPRGRAKLISIFGEWLELDHLQEQSKDPDRFPGFDQQLSHDLRRSLDLFLETVLLSPSSDYRELFHAGYWFASPKMVDFYDLLTEPDPPAKVPEFESQSAEETTTDKNGDPLVGGWLRSPIDQWPTAGLLTHPFLLSGLAYYRESSPIHRGVFVSRKFLGRTLKQPNENFQPLGEEFDPTMTLRERITFQTKDAVCMGCHTIINPIGFSLENFDASGKFRMMEGDKPIDATTVYKTASGEVVSLSGVESLAQFLLNDPAAQQNFIRQLFQLYARQPLQAMEVDGVEKLETLHRSFADNNYNVRQLVVEFAKMCIDDLIQQENP